VTRVNWSAAFPLICLIGFWTLAITVTIICGGALL
jgi:hypothetical protein